MSRPKFVKVDHVLLEHAEALGLDNDLLRVVMALMSYDWQNGNPCRPPQKDIASRCNASVRTVQRRCDRLVKLKLIERTRPSRQHAYRYDLKPLRKRLAELAPEAPEATAGVMLDAEPEATAGVMSRGDSRCHVPRRQQVSPDVDTEDVDTEEEDTHTACARDLAGQVLEEFNQHAQHSYADRKWLAMVEARCREHPDLGLAEHAAVIARNFLVPWWGDSPSPSVLYRDGAAFEQALRATGRPRLSAKAQRVADRNRERLAFARGEVDATGGARAPVIEGSAVEIPNGNGHPAHLPNGNGDDGEPEWKPTAHERRCMDLGRRS